MAEEPELKMATRQKRISPLMAAWGVVIVLIGLAVVWITFSDEPEQIQTPVGASDEAEPTTPPTESSVSLAEGLNEGAGNTPSMPSTGTGTMQESEGTPATPNRSSTTEDSRAAQAPGILETQNALKPAPNDNLLQNGSNGPLPVLGPDGLIAWKEYARPFEGTNDTPRIAILVTDIGLNTRSSNAAIDQLPGQVDLAFSPYGRNLQDWMNKARSKGHEGFLMLPTEPLNYPDNDPGPHTLIADFSERDNLIRLDWILSRVSGYVGVVNHMGSKFTASEEALTPVLTDLNNRGLMLVDARSTRFSMMARVARRMSMPRASNDRYIDNVLTSDDIRRQLGELENTARTFGAALGMARATPLTISEIAEWSQTLEEKGIELTPVTAIANRQPVK